MARMVTESCLRSRQQDWISASSAALFVPGEFAAMARLWRLTPLETGRRRESRTNDESDDQSRCSGRCPLQTDRISDRPRHLHGGLYRRQAQARTAGRQARRIRFNEAHRRRYQTWARRWTGKRRKMFYGARSGSRARSGVTISNGVRTRLRENSCTKPNTRRSFAPPRRRSN